MKKIVPQKTAPEVTALSSINIYPQMHTHKRKLNAQQTDKYTHTYIHSNTYTHNEPTHMHMKMHSDLWFKRFKEAVQEKKS